MEIQVLKNSPRKTFLIPVHACIRWQKITVLRGNLRTYYMHDPVERNILKELKLTVYLFEVGKKIRYVGANFERL